jgi:lipoprotein-releasing system ATP-binding protein
MTITLKLDDVTRHFTQGDETVHVLKGINLTVGQGEIVALVGPSGAGKTTLLQIAGLLELPSTGDVIMAGTHCSSLSDIKRTELRRTYAGFVYQFHHLLPEFTALENVMIPQYINGINPEEASVKAEALLRKLGLGHRLNHRPKKLSGGEQQRVAIARALANDPKLLLADEPTGNLDMHTSDVVFNEMIQLVRETGLSALIATHNLDLAARMDRSVQIKDGILQNS